MPGLTKPSHWIVLLIVVLLLFGAKRLPELAKGVGQSLKIFKKEIKDLQDEPGAPGTSATPEVPEATPPAQTNTPESQDNA
ncbi:Sec-independent protein translocase subunit TatA [Jonesiaceae bacterium BS-20]|uniref:Sec-independent protein translocase protein TatA n=1 Tax=Jonesiaceae bacterium BS-20 TaxID=3120821 RepID=A0AAU7DZL2_9MICO